MSAFENIRTSARQLNDRQRIVETTERWYNSLSDDERSWVDKELVQKKGMTPYQARGYMLARNKYMLLLGLLNGRGPYKVLASFGYNSRHPTENDKEAWERKCIPPGVVWNTDPHRLSFTAAPNLSVAKFPTHVYAALERKRLTGGMSAFELGIMITLACSHQVSLADKGYHLCSIAMMAVRDLLLGRAPDIYYTNHRNYECVLDAVKYLLKNPVTKYPGNIMAALKRIGHYEKYIFTPILKEVNLPTMKLREDFLCDRRTFYDKHFGKDTPCTRLTALGVDGTPFTAVRVKTLRKGTKNTTKHYVFVVEQGGSFLFTRSDFQRKYAGTMPYDFDEEYGLRVVEAGAVPHTKVKDAVENMLGEDMRQKLMAVHNSVAHDTQKRNDWVIVRHVNYVRMEADINAGMAYVDDDDDAKLYYRFRRNVCFENGPSVVYPCSEMTHEQIIRAYMRIGANVNDN